MPKHTKTTEETPTDASEPVVTIKGVAVVLFPFSYPSIGNGITIMARNQAEADKKAKSHPLNQ